METVGGDSWWRRLVETVGGDGWWRWLVETVGGDGWWRQLEEMVGGDGSETGLVTKKKGKQKSTTGIGASLTPE